MKEVEDQTSPRIKFWHIVVIILFLGLISVITSYITVQTVVPTLSTPVSTLATLPSVKSSPSVFPFATKSAVQLQTQQIETNLLQNSGFENDLSGWIYSDNVAGLYVFETIGVNGKAFCSRQYLPYGFGRDEMAEFIQKEWPGFVQEIPIDPNETYFFSAWVRLNKAINVYAMVRYYNGSKDIGWGLASEPVGRLTDGETSNGWFFVYREMPMVPPGTNHARVGFWHGVKNNAPNEIDSTFCVDDLVFGKIVK